MVECLEPQWWVVENPIGRLPKLVPEIAKHRLIDFDPCEFGDPYTKRTVLYGHFNPFLVRSHVKATEGSKMHKVAPGPGRQESDLPHPRDFLGPFLRPTNDAMTWTDLKQKSFVRVSREGHPRKIDPIRTGAKPASSTPGRICARRNRTFDEPAPFWTGPVFISQWWVVQVETYREMYPEFCAQLSLF